MNSPVDVGDVMKLGPWTPKIVQNTGPGGGSWIFYPDPLGKDGLKRVREDLDKFTESLRQWESVTLGADFPES